MNSHIIGIFIILQISVSLKTFLGLFKADRHFCTIGDIYEDNYGRWFDTDSWNADGDNVPLPSKNRFKFYKLYLNSIY